MSGCLFRVPPYLCEKVLKNLSLIQIDLLQLMGSFNALKILKDLSHM